MEVDENDDTVLHFTISGYEFDWEDFTFPTAYAQDNLDALRYTQNIGCFSAGYLQIMSPFADEVPEDTDLFLDVTVSNIKANSSSGKTVETEEIKTDNQLTPQIVMFPPGTYNKWVYFGPNASRYSIPWGSGNTNAPNGTITRIQNVHQYSGDKGVKSVNVLFKFDDDGFEIADGATDTVVVNNAASIVGEWRSYFAAKPDKTGWVSDEEMSYTGEENLIYFAIPWKRLKTLDTYA